MKFDVNMLVEMIGYLSSALVLISFLMSSVVKLRVINAIGGSIFTVYALIIHSYPTALMNVCLVGINIYYLIRLRKNDQNYDLVDVAGDKAFVEYFLDHYKKDIQTYFPDWSGEGETFEKAYIVCTDAVPAGILLGNMNEAGTELEVELDYSVPAYRDCSVGKYLYSKLPAQGIKKLTFGGTLTSHEAYLKKMGFVKEKDVYVKNL